METLKTCKINDTTTNRDSEFTRFWTIAQREVAKLLKKDRRIDEQRAMDVATDCVLKLMDQVGKMSLMENYAKLAISHAFKDALRAGKLQYGGKNVSLPLDDEGEEMQFADPNGSADIDIMEFKEQLEKAEITEAEWDLLDKAQDDEREPLTKAERDRLLRIRKRVKVALGMI